MAKRKFQKIVLIVVALVLAIGCYDLFSKYFKQKEEIRLRTLYYLKTGQILDVVQDEFKEGDKVESNNTTVAEVTDNGGIKAKTPGHAQITVTKQPDASIEQQAPPQQEVLPQEPMTEEEIEKEDEETDSDVGDDSFTFDVEVREPVQGLQLSVEFATLVEGDSLQLTPIFTPSNAFNKNVTYASFQEHIARVNSTGLVTAVHEGTATIQATSEDGGFQSKTQVNVLAKNQQPYQINVKEEQISLVVGDTHQVYATVSSNEALENSLTYQSENTNIFTVDNKGVIKAVGIGTASLQISVEGQTKKVAVTVIEQPVTGVSVAPHSLTMKKGETKELTVVISPSNATNKSVVYSVDNNRVVTVENGKVHAVGVGTATIQVKANYGKTDTCTVEVVDDKTAPSIVSPTSLSVSPSSIRIATGESATITATIEPSNATNKTITYTSADSSIASVDNTGHVYGNKVGKTTIRVMTSNSISKEIPVEVSLLQVFPSSVAVSPTSYTGSVGESFFIVYRIYPDNVTEGGVTFSSSNEKVASVTTNGKVNLNGVGTATITVKTVNDKVATIPITVNKVSPKMSIDKVKFTMDLYTTTTIKASVLPEEYKNAAVLYTSSNPKIVTVDASGKVSAVGVGTATITASLKEDPSVTVTSEVTVKKVDITSLKIRNKKTNYVVNKNVFLNRGETVNLNANIEPHNATYDKIHWKIKDTSIATVTDLGFVKGLKKGITELTLTVGDKSKTVNIVVEQAGDKVYFASLTDAQNPGKNIYSNDAVVFKSNGKVGLLDTSYNESDYVVNGKTVAGDKCQTYINFLQDLGVNKVDFVIITHYHVDHTGCFTNVLKKFDVDKVYWKEYNKIDARSEKTEIIANRIANWRNLMSSRGTKEVMVSKNTKFSLGNFNFKPYNTEQVLTKKLCPEGTSACSNNVESVTYLVTSHNKKLYFAGDIQNAKALNKYPADNAAKEVGKVDILKVAHHAYNFENNSQNEIDALKPSHAIVTNDLLWLYRKGVKTRPAIERIKKYTGENKIHYTNGGFISLTLKSDNTLSFLSGSWK